MRDKLIDIILEAIGYKDLRQLIQQGPIVEAHIDELFCMRWRAERAADALLAAGVVQEWVSVKDALPEAEQIVRIACRQGNHRYECVGFLCAAKTVAWKVGI